MSDRKPSSPEPGLIPNLELGVSTDPAPPLPADDHLQDEPTEVNDDDDDA